MRSVMRDADRTTTTLQLSVTGDGRAAAASVHGQTAR